MNAPTTKIEAPYDVEAIRQDFPILSRTVYGKPLTYLDNAASAQKPNAVIDAVNKAYSEEYANVHRGLHFLSNTATENYEAAREAARQFLNASHSDEIIFTRNATEAINLVADSYGRMAIEEGDEIVLSIMEHHSNIIPWHFHRERKGAVIKWAPVAPTTERSSSMSSKNSSQSGQRSLRLPTCRTCWERWFRSKRSAGSPMRAAFR